jgi:hypothetical protein
MIVDAPLVIHTASLIASTCSRRCGAHSDAEVFHGEEHHHAGRVPKDDVSHSTPPELWLNDHGGNEFGSAG